MASPRPDPPVITALAPCNDPTLPIPPGFRLASSSFFTYPAVYYACPHSTGAWSWLFLPIYLLHLPVHYSRAYGRAYPRFFPHYWCLSVLKPFGIQASRGTDRVVFSIGSTQCNPTTSAFLFRMACVEEPADIEPRALIDHSVHGICRQD